MRHKYSKAMRRLAAVVLVGGAVIGQAAVAGAAPVPDLTISPTPTRAGERMTVSGPDCIGDSAVVAVTFTQPDGIPDYRAAIPSAAGKWSVSFFPGLTGEMGISARCFYYETPASPVDAWEQTAVVQVGEATVATISLDNSTVSVGGTLQVKASGFWPGEDVEVVVHSDPVTLGTLTADASGMVLGSFVIPSSIPPGGHALQLKGLSSERGAGTPITITAADNGSDNGPNTGNTGSGTPGTDQAAGTDTAAGNTASGLAFTGSSSSMMVLAALLALLGGSVLVVATRRGREAEAN